MFYYLYKISEELSEKLKDNDINNLKEKNTKTVFFDDKYIIEENNAKNSQIKSKIKGHVVLEGLNKKIFFEIRLDSNLLLIESLNQKIKDDAFEKLEFFFNSKMDEELENFSPNAYNEYKLLCNAEDFDLKFLHNGSIVDGDIDDKIEDKYRQKKLGKDYRLIEADIQLNDDTSFYYYRKYIMIPDEYDENSKEEVFQTFEHIMS